MSTYVQESPSAQTTAETQRRTAPVARRRERPYRTKGAGGFGKPTLAGLILRYVLLAAVLVLAIGPFVWQLSTSLKGPMDDIYSFPPSLIPSLNCAWHSRIVAVTLAIGNVVLGTMAGYALGCLRFRGKKIAMGILLVTLLLPGEVTIMSQFLTIRSLGLADSLGGVIVPGLVGAINVLL